MVLSPQELYEQYQDTQRILIVGNESRAIAEIIVKAGVGAGKKIAYYGRGESISENTAPVCILAADSGVEFDPHILVIDSACYGITRLIPQMPKGGIIIYNPKDPTVNSLCASRHIADVVISPYIDIASKKANASSLISSMLSNMGRQYQLSPQMLPCIGAAYQVCENLGISARDFSSALEQYFSKPSS